MKKVEELRSLNLSELKEELLALRKNQFNLRMKMANGSLDKTHHLRLTRRTIAKIKTIMTEKVGQQDV